MKKMAGGFDSFNKMCAKDVGVTVWSLKQDCPWLKDMDLKHQFVFEMGTALFIGFLVLLLC